MQFSAERTAAGPKRVRFGSRNASYASNSHGLSEISRQDSVKQCWRRASDKGDPDETAGRGDRTAASEPYDVTASATRLRRRRQDHCQAEGLEAVGEGPKEEGEGDWRGRQE